MNFEKLCPNCNKPWDLNLNCFPCNLHRSTTPSLLGKGYWIFRKLGTAPIGPFLYWNADGTCEYQMGIDNIILPFLDFDITEEQLKVYLTFS